ncbi:MAG: hypothetical protein LH474_07685 [Chamaesiphon sp.]|nr:hypothetical protein [Chamaesiphon sp.]
MKNISRKTLLTLGLSSTSILLAITPAFAGDYKDYKGFNDALKRAYPAPTYQPPAPTPYRSPVSTPSTPYQSPGSNSRPSSTPSGSYTPSSGSSDSSGLEGFGEIFSLFNFGPSAISSNGNIQYGVQSKFGFENIRVRTAMHFGSGNSINGAFTYSMSGEPTMFNPFIGGGVGYKSIQQTGKADSNAFAFYGTGGVDLNLTNNLSISGAVNLPTDSNYGTEFQAAINFFGSF